MTYININDIFILDVNFWKDLPTQKFQKNIHNLIEDISKNGLNQPIIISNIDNNIYTPFYISNADFSIVLSI
jgi:hypothetical protein